MKRVKLIVAYDGSKYCGWQLQPGLATVEGELNKALSSLLGEEIQVIGASRTDSGVHALGNVAVFDTESRIPAEKISLALNQRLAEDIRIMESSQVNDDFHPRKVISYKTYEYRISNRRIPYPTERFYSSHVYVPLDVDLMAEAARNLLGRHDFKSFCSVKTTVEDTVREIYQLEVRKDVDMITIRVTGGGFLYNMVRIIAGTLIEVGRGAIAPWKVKEILEACDRNQAGPTALAQGLTLIAIEYPEKVSNNCRI